MAEAKELLKSLEITKPTLVSLVGQAWSLDLLDISSIRGARVQNGVESS